MVGDTISITADPGDITFEAPKNTLKLECKDLEIQAQNSSSYTVQGSLSESSDTRSESITGADTIKVSKTWNVTGSSTSVSAGQSSLSAKQISCSVSGGLSLSNSAGREISSDELRRETLASETVTAPKMSVEGAESINFVSNGAITLSAAGKLDLKSGDATLSTTAMLSLQAGDLQIEGKAGLAIQGQLLKLC